MRRLALILLLLVTIALARAEDAAPPKAYTRISNPDTNTVQLQIALRKFVPAQKAGPVIWLAGVMHIGEPAYYHALQHFLEAQTVVLYEGINPDAHPHHVHEAQPIVKAPPPGTNTDDSLQSTLAHSLGLVFQLDAIDYDRTNFLNSDLSVQEIQRIMAGAPGQKTSTNASFDVLLQIMDGSSFLGSLFKMGLNFIADNPQVQAVAKLTLIEAIGRLQGDLSDVQGLPPDWKQLIKVLIQARNQNLLSDLAAELKKIPASGSVAVFYGAGHMDDMEKHVTADLHYVPAEDVWLPAFSVDMQKSGITPAEAQWMQKLIEGQMDQMQKH